MSERETWDDWITDGRAIRYHSPDDFGWDGLDRTIFFRTKAKGLDLIVRPSGTPGTVSLFVGNNLIHIPAADVEKIATVMLRAANEQATGAIETARDYLAKWEERIGPVEAERIMAATRDFLDSLPDDEAADG